MSVSQESIYHNHHFVILFTYDELILDDTRSDRTTVNLESRSHESPISVNVSPPTSRRVPPPILPCRTSLVFLFTLSHGFGLSCPFFGHTTRVSGRSCDWSLLQCLTPHRPGEALLLSVWSALSLCVSFQARPVHNSGRQQRQGTPMSLLCVIDVPFTVPLVAP